MRYVVLLRGINLGSRNRISMPDLRAALEEAGFEEVATHLQSGNVVLTSKAAKAGLARRVEKVVGEQLGLDIPVVVRTRAELAKVVEANPLGKVAKDPKRYQVSFFDGALSPAVVARLEAAVAPGEKLVVSGREAYAWHPHGIGRSKLWNALAGKLGVTATARNWATVTKLLELADG